jgi:Transmembrane domain of unknown function (DUF3566)
VVTSRRTSDNLIDDQDAPTSDIMAPPRQQPRKPATPASPGDAVSDGTAGGGASPNGTSAAGKENTRAQDAAANGVARDAARPPATDETVVDGVPALPADTIGVSRNARSKPADPASADPSPASGSPVSSFGPPLPAAAEPAVEDPTIAYPAESGVKPPAVDPVPPGSPAPGGARSAGAVPPPGSRPAPADPPLSPAAFAWDMPDPPPSSPSSPARTFLRSGTTPRDPVAPKAPPPKAAPATAAAGQATTAKAPGPSAGPATAAGPALRGPGLTGPGLRANAQKGQKARQKRTTARQAHLTIARVEPWSVMKFSFVVSLVAFVILFVAVSVLYGALAGLGVFDSLQRVVSSVTSSQGSAGVNAKAWFSASRVLGYTALLGSLNIVLITAMSTIGAVVYNLTSRLVGGVEVTLRETE